MQFDGSSRSKLEISRMPAMAACQLNMCECAYVFRRGFPMINEIVSTIVIVRHELVSNVRISNIVPKQIFTWSQGDNDEICRTFL